jgi:hypothetical protein
MTAKTLGTFLYVPLPLQPYLAWFFLGSDSKLDPDPESESDPTRVVMVDEAAFLTGYTRTGLLVKTLSFELFTTKKKCKM